MKDRDSEKSFFLSRRGFLSLTLLLGWPLMEPGSPPRFRLVGLSQEQKKRKQHFLTQKRPTAASSIADAIVLKDENVFFLCEQDGNVPVEEGHAYGLYYHDCRYLNGYELRLDGKPAPALGGSATPGFMGTFELFNQEMKIPDGATIKKEQIGLRWTRIVDGRNLTLHDALDFQHYGRRAAEFPVSFDFRAGFEDLYAVKGMLKDKLGTVQAPMWRDGALTFLYDGKDNLYRSLTVHFSPAADRSEGSRAWFHMKLDPEETKQLRVSLVIRESADRRAVEPKPIESLDIGRLESRLHQEAEAWLNSAMRISSDSFVLQRLIDRSLRDLRVLRSTIDNETFFAGGVPWFVTLFGRDSIITALQMLAYSPDIGAQVLRLLAKYQGQRDDEWRDEQPGKILHELRVGEAAHLNLIPHTPYYGTVDATALFLILIGRHAAWTGTLALFEELRDHVERALDWMDRHGDRRGESYLAYTNDDPQKGGLTNQGWKDSGDAIVNADGGLAEPPIALVEAQGYAYWAKSSIADLFARSGDNERADRLRREAATLRNRFNRDFWLEDHDFYALALQAGNRPAAVMSSNPGQALLTGIVDPDKAKRTMERLMADDMFSGWGIRTLSEKEKAYNPGSYHLGSVWPHDNALIGAGLRRYGFDEAFLRVFKGLVEAAIHFKADQLPELFCGFSRERDPIPVRYPVADHPQAWASGSMPYLIETLLGLTPEAFEGRLRIVRPLLPDFIHHLEVRRLRVGEAEAHLRFERGVSGQIEVHVLQVDGRLDVVTESSERKR
ncbi:MAG: Glycogen debranching enzyme [Nitrospira sp.]|jgi:glycogen debranching enzyme|nr:MAG: Glycogen debranching enzyme [Nitrospira sp.]